MKKIVSMVMAVVMLGALCLGFTGCGEKALENLGAGNDYSVGVCQLMEHESLDKATKGFEDALTEELAKAGKTVDIDVQVAGEPDTAGYGDTVSRNRNIREKSRRTRGEL